jgi:hypothetical protein
MLELGRKILHNFTGSPEDRRAHPRLRTNLRTVCRPVGGDRQVTTWIQDVSRGGIKLRLGEPFREGTMVQIDLPPIGAELPTTILACVMHANATAAGEWELGCNFSLELSDQEVRAFGGAKPRPGSADQRAWVRHPARGMVEFRVLPGADGPPQAGQLVNLSQAGVGLILTDRLEPGCAMTVTLKRQDDGPDRSLLACVVYQSRRPDGKWAVGCNFLHELSEKELSELLWHSDF